MAKKEETTAQMATPTAATTVTVTTKVGKGTKEQSLSIAHAEALLNLKKSVWTLKDSSFELVEGKLVKKA